MKLLKSKVNLATGEITGCEEGTLLYYHESRHIWQFKFGLFKIQSYIFMMCAIVWAFAATTVAVGGPKIWNIVGLWVWGVLVIWILLLEIDAWVYGIMKVCF